MCSFLTSGTINTVNICRKTFNVCSTKIRKHAVVVVVVVIIVVVIAITVVAVTLV